MTIETDRLIAPEQGARVDEQLDRAIRPKSLEDYLGQRVVCEQMEIFLAAAKQRGEPLDHTLIFGPPWAGQNNPCQHYCSRDGCGPKNDQWPGP